MVLWGFRWLRLFVNPYADDDFKHISSESERRSYILERLELAEFSEWSWVVIVAGVGFFTDAYSIFSINMVVPMLGIIYYGGTMPHGYETALSVVTLGGSIIGMVGFGLGADIWGRRKMYGLELIITIASTLGVVMSSNGIEGSMSVIVWLLVWRFVLGIGIGADYPLSAIICSEFAPTKWRGKMLTAVFACQPLGQLAATLVALITAARQRDQLPADATAQKCDAQCLRTMDSIWRWIIGVGVIPAVIALWFRLTIIESPRWVADVGRDSKKAAKDLNRYLPMQAETAVVSNTSFMPQAGAPQRYQVRRTSSVSSDAISNADSGAVSDDGAILGDGEPSPCDIRRSEQTPKATDAVGNPLPKNDHVTEIHSGAGSQEAVSARSISPMQYTGDLLGQHRIDIPQLEGVEEVRPPPPPSWKDFKQYFWHDGNLRTLMATSFCWFCVDLPFYGLGMNSPHIISTIWYGQSSAPTLIYPMLVNNVWQSLIVVSLGACVGCAVTFVSIDKLGRRNIQIIGFFWLFLLFIVIGGSFNHLYDIGGNSAIIVLYILCQIFFNFGPNTTSYIIPSELFPTRYRALCHGISAASGKLGSVIAQLFLAYINYGHGINYNTIQKWLPYSLLIFSIFMLLGLITTVFWIPGDEHGPTGKVKTLEEWEVGRDTPNRFAQTKIARIVERCWKLIARMWDVVYMILDGLAGGDEKERRELEAEELRERQMQEMEIQRGRSVLNDAPIASGGEGHGIPGPRDFVNGHAEGNRP